MEIRPTISVKNRKTGERGRYRMDQEKVLVGRDRACLVFLENKTVSRHHAEISHEGPSFFLRDLRSGNQTYLNNIPLPAEEKTILTGGDLIRIGDYELRFAIPSPGDSDIYEATDSDILEIKMMKKLLKALDRESAPSLEVIEGPLPGQRFVLEGKSQEITIGRDIACEFRIDSDIISRKHARLLRKWDAVEIEDLGSRNGIYVTGEKIRQRRLHDGDKIHLGTIILQFRNPQELALDLVPPKKLPDEKKEPEAKRPAEATPPREEVPSAVEPAASTHQAAGPRFPFSILEILMALLGLVVLGGAIWAIVKIL